MGEWVTLLNGRLEVIIEQISNKRFSVQISDHALEHTCILDDTYNSIDEALNASLKLLKLKYKHIGARRQLGGKRSSKPFPSVSKTECVGSIPTAPANNSVTDTLRSWYSEATCPHNDGYVMKGFRDKLKNVRDYLESLDLA